MEFLFLKVELTLWGLLGAWPITVFLIIAIVAALAYNSPFSWKNYDRSHLLVLLPFWLTILILLVSSSPWTFAVVFPLVLAHLPIIALLARRFWQYQLSVLAIGVFQMWVSFVAAFVGSARGFFA